MKVEDILRHETGIVSCPEELSIMDLRTENIKQNSIGSKFEKAKPIFVPSKRAYHPASRGWMLNEIFRRVEPS